MVALARELSAGRRSAYRYRDNNARERTVWKGYLSAFGIEYTHRDT